LKKPKLGQNFLHDKNVLEKIARLFDPQSNDVVVEIGAGTGALTKHVAPHVSKYYAIEIDSKLIPQLQTIPNIEIVHADFLEIRLENLGKYLRIIGNLPYYISTSILTTLITQRSSIKDMVLMFQEEVAKRIVAPASDSEYSLLSVLSQYFCTIDKGFKISKNSFRPVPEIDSRVLHFQFNVDTTVGFDEYLSLLQKAFSQRRKKLRNNLIRELKIEPERLDAIFKELGISENARAEELTPKQFEELARRL
jgi:16S rRNA (adenine1518-N6/adenine1519-N6)-dimethyltransferase